MYFTAIIVTYSNRFSLLKQVISACIAQGIHKIIVVDNASAQESKRLLIELESITPRLHVCYLPENIGSSGGFKFAISEALKDVNSEFLWLLDDDNVPQPGALKALVEAYNLLSSETNKPVLYSYRGEVWEDDHRAVYNGIIKKSITNGFCGFDFFTALKKKIKNLTSSTSIPSLSYPVIRTQIGPYGGMFTHIENIKKIGLPNEDYFVYADDHDFTSRFEDYGIAQYLVFNSKLKDIDISVSSGDGYFKDQTSELKIYYGLRNTTYFYRRHITNRLYYSFNKTVFFSMLYLSAFQNGLTSPTLVKRRLKLIKKAISEGEKGILGKTFGN